MSWEVAPASLCVGTGGKSYVCVLPQKKFSNGRVEVPQKFHTDGEQDAVCRGSFASMPVTPIGEISAAHIGKRQCRRFGPLSSCFFLLGVRNGVSDKQQSHGFVCSSGLPTHEILMDSSDKFHRLHDGELLSRHSHITCFRVRVNLQCYLKMCRIPRRVPWGKSGYTGFSARHDCC